MLKPFFNAAWPHIVVVAFFALLSLIYVSPVLEGKRLFQSDIVKHIGMSKEIVDYRERTGEEPLWTNSMFGGMPAYQISVLYKNNIATLFHDVLTLGLPRPADMIFLYFLGFFILMISLGANIWLSALAATGFALSSYHFIIIEAGHNSKAVAIAYMAPALAGILMALKGKIIAGSIITAIFLGLQIYANHLQITYYLLIITLITGAALLINDIREKQTARFFKALGALSLAAIIAVGLNFSKLFTTWEYSKDTIRGGSELTYDIEIQTGRGLDFEYATQWSYGISETFTLLVPNLKGGESGRLGVNEEAMHGVDQQFRNFIAGQNHYWGEQPFTSGPVYVGVAVLFLFLFGAMVLRGPLKWALVIATVLSIMLAWGRNFEPLTMFFLENVPLYNKFRAVSMTLVIAELTIPFLAFLTLWKILEQPTLVRTKRIEFLTAIGLTAGVALLFYIAPRLFFGYITSHEAAMFNEHRQTQPSLAQTIDLIIFQLEEVRIGIMQADAIRSFTFAIITALALWIFGNKKYKPIHLIGVLFLIIMADMWTINRRYLNNDNFVPRRQMERPFQPTQANKQILNDPDLHFRVLNLTTNTFNESGTSFFHSSIGGYHGAKLQRFQDLIDHHITKGNHTVNNMLNTKYLIVLDANRQPVAQLNPDALGNGWFVSQYRIVQNADEESAALNQLQPLEWIVTDKRFVEYLANQTFEADPNASITLTYYAPNRLLYEAQTATQQIAVLSEIYYAKGWNAYLNGKPKPHFRANYILRAMVVPPGNHEIEFRFEPRSYKIGEQVSFAFSSLLILLIVGWGVVSYKKWL